MADVAILTEKRYLKATPNNWYVDNILKEDGLVLGELEKLNIRCARVAWDGNVNLASFKCALFRTTWNYFDEFNLFVRFLKKSKDVVELINPYEQILWNLNKKYLFDLSKSSINIPSTEIIKKGTTLTLEDICLTRGWEDIVIKPCVSAAAWQTYYIPKNKRFKFENVFSSLLQKHDMMIQVFQKNIKSFGEISLMMIGGVYTHAILKRAKKGDFRVQDDYGGSVSSYLASKKEIQFATRIIKSLKFKPVYARVDIILDNNKQLALSELELIEPEMWFRFYPDAAKKLAIKIKQKYF